MRAQGGRSSVRVQPGGGPTNIETGLPVLDHLLALLAEYADFGLALQVEPGSADAEVSVSRCDVIQFRTVCIDYTHADFVRSIG